MIEIDRACAFEILCGTTNGIIKKKAVGHGRYS